MFVDEAAAIRDNGVMHYVEAQRRLAELGHSPADNLAQLDRLKELAERQALPPDGAAAHVPLCRCAHVRGQGRTCPRRLLTLSCSGRGPQLVVARGER